MSFPNVWGAPEWWPVAIGFLLLIFAALLWSYARNRIPIGWRIFLALLKTSGVALLAMCLLEPMQVKNRPQVGRNLFIVAADSSKSMTIRDRTNGKSRADQLKRLLSKNQTWLSDLDADYDLRRYQFNSRLNSVNDFASYLADGSSTSLAKTLQVIGDRYRDKPIAGVMVLTDGNSTETFAKDFSWEGMPPVYPVIIGRDQPGRDIRIVRTTISQSNFETAPVALAAELEANGFAGRSIEVKLFDDQGEELDHKTVTRVQNGKRFTVRFQIKPQKRGVAGFKLKAFAKGNEDLAESSEATIVNNQRLLAVDQNRGPYRILYVSGRPNWEFKFLRRALAEDDEIDLVGLMRIAKREPKFTFRAHEGESKNPLFRGFGNQQDEQAEQYDEPVLIRMGVSDREELRSGFPKSAEGLFSFDAIILDDVEAGFFSEDQKSLMQQFVSLRGGGLLMLGGQESFVKGKFDRTPIGEMLPVYVDRFQPTERPSSYQLQLTREGWLQPWVRVRSTQEKERVRLESMPAFKTINRVSSIKPGASVLATVKTDDGNDLPALVVQRFGEGRASALLLGDFWRWHLKNENENDDLLTAWRQIARWLVSETPQRVDTEIKQGENTTEILVRAYDSTYKLLDNAQVKIEVQLPEGETVELAASPVGDKSGLYRATFVPRQSGLYQVQSQVIDSDESEVGTDESGWVANLEANEFEQIAPNRALLEEIAKKTGGEVVDSNALGSFVDSLGNRSIPFVEKVTHPWWHHWNIFLLAIALLVSEWGIRRWKGLA